MPKATQPAPLPSSLTPLHKQRSRVSRLTASASVSTISPANAQYLAVFIFYNFFCESPQLFLQRLLTPAQGLFQSALCRAGFNIGHLVEKY